MKDASKVAMMAVLRVMSSDWWKVDGSVISRAAEKAGMKVLQTVAVKD